MGGLDKRLYTSPHASTDTVSRVGPDRVVRSQRWHVAERSETEFIELYASTTPMHSSHCITPHTYPSTGRTCTHSVSAIDVEHLLLHPVAISGLLRWLPSGAYHGCMWVGYCAERFLTIMRKRDQSHPLARDDGAVNNDGHETGTKTGFIFENPFLPGGP